MSLDPAPTVVWQAYEHRFPSTRAPANYCCFDAVAGIYALPSAAAPSAQEWNDTRADVILAKEFKELVRRWYAFMNIGIDALLPCYHSGLDYPCRQQFD